MGAAQWAQKCEQADIEIFLAIIYKIKFLKTFIKSKKLIVKQKVIGKYFKTGKSGRPKRVFKKGLKV